MIDNVQHGVLAAVLNADSPEDLERFMYATSQLSEDHFAPYERACWMLMTRLLSATGVLPDYDIIDHYLPTTQLTVEVQAEVRNLWLQLSGLPPVDEADFKYAVYMTHEERKKELFAESLATAGEVLTFGKRIGNEDRQGYEDARRYFEDQVMKIDGMERDHMPEGNMREEREELLDIQTSASMVKLPTGIRSLDTLTAGGVSPGQLVLLAGYTNEGKSMWLVNIAHSIILQGRNVVFFTTETVKPDVNMRMAVRHSHLPHFNCPGGLSYTEVMENNLSPEHYGTYQQVVEDFTNPDSPYGRFDVVQVPEDTPMSFLRAKLRAYQSIFHVDAVMIDELQMLSAAHKREREREELNQVVRAAKQLAVDFDGGRGVPVISPWQMSRNAWDNARTNGGRYTRSSLSETAEAERRADVVISMFKHTDSLHRVSAQVLKQRSGPIGDFELHVDYGRCFVGAAHSGLESDLPPMDV